MSFGGVPVCRPSGKGSFLLVHQCPRKGNERLFGLLLWSLD